MGDNNLIVSAGENLRDVIVEAHAKDVAVVLRFHGHRLSNVSHGLFQVPQQNASVVAACAECAWAESENRWSRNMSESVQTPGPIVCA